ncbi:MAG: phosphatidate cytidylyltransferase [Clostridia bacterium]|nr:phosphatidate cytidylyltransferase [Clostridia bacterium]
MDIKRWVSALIGMPLVVIILVLGNTYVVDITFAIVAGLSLHEYFNAFKEKAHPVIWMGYVSSFLIALIHVIPVQHAITIVSVLIPIGITILFLQVILSNMKTNINDIAITFFGICYISLFLMFVPLIHAMEYGKFLVWLVLAAAWGTDILAYLVGKSIGKHKFSEISPNKTIEGCIAGVIGAVLFGAGLVFVFNHVFNMNFSYVTVILIEIILSVVGQIGDFAASSIKRYVGIKDFSNLIPGHGGMLDRLDSIIFIAPFAYMLIRLL